MAPGQQGTALGKPGFIKGNIRMRTWEPSVTINDMGRAEALGQVSDSPTCQSRESPWELVTVMLESPPQKP